ncbi:MAG: glutathione S-transferase family protein [Gammaproteobacteria bacterium]
MAHEITLYGLGPTRSARCRWTLLELDVPFDYVEDRALIGSDELRPLHPQAKFPVAVIDGEPLFESAAICTVLCDLVPGNSLLARPGTRERALHEQWTSFVLSEMEAYLWSNAKHTAFYPEEKRVAAVVEPNFEEFRNGAQVLEDTLANQQFLVGDTFSVTDIIAGWCVNWGRRQGQLEPFPNLRAYLTRLFERELCTLNPE